MEERTLSLGEVRKRIGQAIASKLRKFLKSDQEKVGRALSLLASDTTINPATAEQIREFCDEQGRVLDFLTLLASLDPGKVDYVLNQIYAAMDTPEWLIKLRAALDDIIKEQKKSGASSGDMKQLRALAGAFTHYFAKIFNFQYLITRCCNAQNTSIALLKFISEKEGVHPAEHWWNFENRLNSPDHIILSLEHFKMPNIPLVYVEVALSKGIVRKIHRIIGEKRRSVGVQEADTAMFYSLNTTLPGLSKIGLGAKMVVRAREYLQRNYPRIKRFSTLSPIPKFGAYLTTVLKDGPHDFSLTRKKIDVNKHSRFVSGATLKALKAELSRNGTGVDGLGISGIIMAVLATDGWYRNSVFRKEMKAPLTALTRYYIEREKRFNRQTKGKMSDAYDPVTNFHLSNGSYIGGIDYLANISERGLKESCGMMVNYVYDGDMFDRNKLLYSTGKVVIKD
jgi:malonyl-CoA decarboxylase